MTRLWRNMSVVDSASITNCSIQNGFLDLEITHYQKKDRYARKLQSYNSFSCIWFLQPTSQGKRLKNIAQKVSSMWLAQKILTVHWSTTFVADQGFYFVGFSTWSAVSSIILFWCFVKTCYAMKQFCEFSFCQSH